MKKAYSPSKDSEKKKNLYEKTICVSRHSRTVTGGRIMSFSALVVIGDMEGQVGYARGRALAVQDAVTKALAKARRRLVHVAVSKNTIPYPLMLRSGATKVHLLPASPGTGIIASNALKSVFESIGIKDILSKVYGSTNPMNVVKAAIDGLKNIRPIKYYAQKRGMTYDEMFYAQDAHKEQ